MIKHRRQWMTARRRHCLALLGLGLILLVPTAAPAAEFSAVIVKRFEGKEFQDKIYVKGDKVYGEVDNGAGATIVIMRRDKKVAWIVMPDQQMYTEMPYSEELMKGLRPVTDLSAAKHLGTETVNGYLTDKFEMSVKTNGGQMKHFMWVSKKLGTSIKETSVDGSYLMEYRDIKEGDVADQVFEVPAGFKKQTLPPGLFPMK